MRRRRAAAPWVAAIGYAAAIFVFSAQPVPAPAEGVLAALGGALHAVEYAGLAILLALALATTPFPRVRSRADLIALAAAVAYAASDEFHQTFVPGRRGDVADLVADAIGATVAALAYRAWRWRADRVAAVSGISPP